MRCRPLWPRRRRCRWPRPGTGLRPGPEPGPWFEPGPRPESIPMSMPRPVPKPTVYPLLSLPVRRRCACGRGICRPHRRLLSPSPRRLCRCTFPLLKPLSSRRRRRSVRGSPAGGVECAALGTPYPFHHPCWQADEATAVRSAHAPVYSLHHPQGCPRWKARAKLPCLLVVHQLGPPMRVVAKAEEVRPARSAVDLMD